MRRMMVVLAGMALILAMAGPANAVPTLDFTSGATNFQVADGSGLDSNPLSGVVTYIGSVGNFLINVTTGISSNSLNYMDLNSVDSTIGAAFGGTDSLTIKLSDTGFGVPSESGFNFLIGGTSAGTISYYAYYDPDNALFALTNEIGTGGVSGPGPFSYSTGESINDALFSLTEVVTITLAAGQTTSFDAEVSVPEPSSILLLGTGLLGAAFYGRRRGRK